jgi:uncharacterized protein YeaO (DUF488 family)
MKLNHRITVLVSLAQELQDHISDQSIHKLLFIYCHKYACNNAYDFIWHNNGPYCITIHEDKKLLVQKRILQDLVNWMPNPEAFRFAKNLDMLEKLSLQKLKNDIEKGLIIDEVINQNYYAYFKTLEIESDEKIFYTIGYEGLNLEQYLNQLLKHKVHCLCDVRRNPYSQKFGFTKMELMRALEKIGLEYIHIPDLGISSALRQDLKSDSDYYNLLKHYEVDILSHQHTNIELLKSLLTKYTRIAITCFEAKISHCHRSKIANLMQEEYIVRHI